MKVREELLDRTDPDNTAQVQKLTHTSTQIELIPVRKRKVNAELQAAIERANAFIEQPLHYCLSGVVSADKDATAAKIIAAIEPFCGKAKLHGCDKTPAELIAESCAIMAYIDSASKPSTALAGQPGNRGPKEIIAYLEEVIAILESYVKAGSFSAKFSKAA